MEQEKLEAGQLRALNVEKSELDNNNDIINNTIKEIGVGVANEPLTVIAVFSIFVAVCGSFTWGCSIGYSSPAEAGIMKDLGLSVSNYSLFGSIMTIGGIIGAMFSGTIVSFFGLKKAIWITEVFGILGWAAIMFAKHAWTLYTARLSLGIGVGLLTYVIPIYNAEIAPSNLRGAFSTAHPMAGTVGFSLLFFSGNLISWRTMAVIGGAPLVVQFFGLFFIPESPRWLAKAGKEKQFRDALQRLRGKEADTSKEALDIMQNIQSLQQTGQSFWDLFQKRYRKALIIGVGVMILPQLSGGSGINFYASSIVQKFGFSTKIGTTIIAILQIPSTLLSLYMVDKSGRQPLLIASAIVTSISCLVVAISFCLQGVQHLDHFTSILGFVGLLLYITAFNLGLAGIPWTIMSEIFPVNVKASAGSLVTLVNWASCWLLAYIFNFMMEWSQQGTFFIFAGLSCLMVLFFWKYVPETKGRTLEEIQASFGHPTET